MAMVGQKVALSEDRTKSHHRLSQVSPAGYYLVVVRLGFLPPEPRILEGLHLFLGLQASRVPEEDVVVLPTLEGWVEVDEID